MITLRYRIGIILVVLSIALHLAEFVSAQEPTNTPSATPTTVSPTETSIAPTPTDIFLWATTDQVTVLFNGPGNITCYSRVGSPIPANQSVVVLGRAPSVCGPGTYFYYIQYAGTIGWTFESSLTLPDGVDNLPMPTPAPTNTATSTPTATPSAYPDVLTATTKATGATVLFEGPGNTTCYDRTYETIPSSSTVTLIGRAPKVCGPGTYFYYVSYEGGIEGWTFESSLQLPWGVESLPILTIPPTITPTLTPSSTPTPHLTYTPTLTPYPTYTPSPTPDRDLGGLTPPFPTCGTTSVELVGIGQSSTTYQFEDVTVATEYLADITHVYDLPYLSPEVVQLQNIYINDIFAWQGFGNSDTIQDGAWITSSYLDNTVITVNYASSIDMTQYYTYVDLETAFHVYSDTVGGYCTIYATASSSLPTPSPTATSTNTPIPPTATPTNTPIPPTATSTNTPTATSTNTPIPPTATFTNTPTNTPVPPTATFTNTPIPPTNTPVPPTATPIPPTNTPVSTSLGMELQVTTDNTQQSQFRYKVINNGTQAESGLSVRFYFTTDNGNSASSYVLEKYWDQSGSAVVSGPTAFSGDTYYFTITYSGTLSAGSSWEYAGGFHLNNWAQTFSSANDWWISGGASGSFSPTNTLPVFKNGTLVTGTTP